MPGLFLQGLFNGNIEQLILDFFFENLVFAYNSQGAGEFPCSRNRPLAQANRSIYTPHLKRNIPNICNLTM